MYCNNNIQCHDTRQKDNIMVQINLYNYKMAQTGFKQRNLIFPSSINNTRKFFNKICVKSKALAQILHNN